MATDPLTWNARALLHVDMDVVVERYGHDAIGYGLARRLRPATPAYDPPDDGVGELGP